jgi:hypothetical protein
VRIIPDPLPDDYDPRNEPIAKKARAIKAEKRIADMGAIAVLERRSRQATKDVELPGGDVIQIRARLPKTEMQECARLFEAIAAAHGAGDTATVEASSNALIGHLLYVDGMAPDEIAAWLDANPDKFSDLDAAEIVLGFGRMMIEEQARRERLQSFRAEP